MARSSTTFQKNKSGNPKGRPKKDHAALDWLEQHSKGGQKYFEIADTIADGTLTVKRTLTNNQGEFVEADEEPSHRERLAAITILTNRLMGMPKQSTEVSGPGGEAFSLVINTRPPSDK